MHTDTALVCFLDILGYKELVKDISEPDAFFEKFNKVYAELADISTVKDEDVKKLIKIVLSDSIIIALDLEDKELSESPASLYFCHACFFGNMLYFSNGIIGTAGCFAARRSFRRRFLSK